MSLKKISRLHFLTPQPYYHSSFFSIIEESLSAGIDWIQYRDKNNDEATFIKIANELQSICKHYKATFIINDRVEVAKLLKADGVHIGQNDESIITTRLALGDEAIIGVSTNNIEQILAAQMNGADYVGYGPFQFTTTRKNLNPIVGLAGYQSLLLNTNLQIPVVAIGGLDDVSIFELKKTGVEHFAVSGAIANANDVKEAISKIKTIIG